ncbi:Poly(A) polymerase [Giardia muris]|uniref:polynucleotide adenylyltransferase n=1 Tax=Giardia muris TaxID=5742 RepID=A0A4Z1SVE6_GIAMU|nr:Poly(A) polymerase [Giardia muris]|eukprot:TNJ27558.1 Poly(A) polymerase [Giardia muris]
MSRFQLFPYDLQAEHYALLDSLLDQYMKGESVATRSERNRRQQDALATLKALLTEWVRGLRYQGGGFPATYMAGGTSHLVDVLPYGSYLLGVSSGDSDIDVVTVFPSDITKEQVMRLFPNVLRQRQDVTYCNVIDRATVPIIRFILMGVEFDMSICILNNITVVGTDYLYLDMQNMQPKSVLAINGYRTNLHLKRLLVEAHVLEPFQKLVLILKLWCKRNNIYGNKFGYFGGINCSILVAALLIYTDVSNTQFANPEKVPISLWLYNFFGYYAGLDWGKTTIQLPDQVRFADTTPHEIVALSWPRNLKADGPMRLITAVEPYINSTGRVTSTTLNVIVSKFSQGAASLNRLAHALTATLNGGIQRFRALLNVTLLGDLLGDKEREFFENREELEEDTCTRFCAIQIRNHHDSNDKAEAVERFSDYIEASIPHFQKRILKRPEFPTDQDLQVISVCTLPKWYKTSQLKQNPTPPPNYSLVPPDDGYRTLFLRLVVRNTQRTLAAEKIIALGRELQDRAEKHHKQKSVHSQDTDLSLKCFLIQRKTVSELLKWSPPGSGTRKVKS